MAQQINHVVIGGNLTRDPELRSLQSGTSVCKLRIANNRRAKINDEWVDKPGYFDVTVWGKQGENCATYLSKGSSVMVRGELRWREWQTDDGGKRQAVEINADEVQFTGGGNSGGGGGQQQAAPQSDVPPDTTDLGVPASTRVGADDDIPF